MFETAPVFAIYEPELMFVDRLTIAMLKPCRVVSTVELLAVSTVCVLLLPVGRLDILREVAGVASVKALMVGGCDEGGLYEAASLGAKGCLPAAVPPELFRQALEEVAGGGVWFGRKAAALIIHGLSRQVSTVQRFNALSCLSTREMDVLTCVAQGMKNREVAQSLHITEATVKTHLYRIYDKLGVKGRLEASLMLKTSSNSY